MGRSIGRHCNATLVLNERLSNLSAMDYRSQVHELRIVQTYDPPPPKPLTRTERLQVAHYRSFRDRIHEGPLYSVLGDNVRVGKHGASAAAQFDPFEGMPTYSMKYKKKRRRLPKLDTRPYGIAKISS